MVSKRSVNRLAVCRLDDCTAGDSSMDGCPSSLRASPCQVTDGDRRKVALTHRQTHTGRTDCYVRRRNQQRYLGTASVVPSGDLVA